MVNSIRVVLFSEVNSKLGSPFLDLLAEHPMVDLVGVVTSRPGRLCSYFTEDQEQVDLDTQARRLGVDVFRPVNINAPEVVATLQTLRPDYFIIGNYQQILKRELLDVPLVTSVNFHPSPLPRYAGLAPFYWMVRHGERHGGVTAIEVDEGIDTGRIIMQRKMRLTGRETALQLRTAQEPANVRMLKELIPKLVDRSFMRMPQDLNLRSYFGRPRKCDYLIDFAQDAETAIRIVRAGYRHPGAYALRTDGSKVVILATATAGGLHREPLAEPGTVRRTAAGLFVAARDEWIRVISIEQDGVEVQAGRDPSILTDGMLLTASVLV
jgi:methionyl-tRNA formyltransferase